MEQGPDRTMSKLDNIDLKLAEVLDGVNQALQRLVSLEERSQWHQQGLGQLKEDLKDNAKRVTDLEKASIKVELLEKEIGYIISTVAEARKDIEVLKGVAAELDKTTSNSTGFLNNQKTIMVGLLTSLVSSLGVALWSIIQQTPVGK